MWQARQCLIMFISSFVFFQISPGRRSYLPEILSL